MKNNLAYGVKFIYRRKDKWIPKGAKENTMQYIVKVTYIEKSEGKLRCVLNRKGFAVNGRLVHRLMDVFAEKCSGVLYPFVFRIGRSGVLLGIDNFDEIQERWTNAPDYVTNVNPSCSKTIISYQDNGETKQYATIDLNLIADDDYVDIISWLVNGGSNGLSDRKKFTKKAYEVLNENNYIEDCLCFA